MEYFDAILRILVLTRRGIKFCKETSNQFSASEVFENFLNSPQALPTNSKTKRNLRVAFSSKFLNLDGVPFVSHKWP